MPEDLVQESTRKQKLARSFQVGEKKYNKSI